MRLKKEPFQGQLTEEQRAFLNQIYIAMYSTIYHYAIAAVQNEPLAQEIAQIVFTKACNDPESIMASPRPNGWLVKALRHTLQEYYRERDRAVELTERSAMVSPTVHRDDYFDVEYSDILDSEEMKLLRLVDVEGFSTRDAAEAFGIAEAACRKRLQRAREKLRGKIF